MQMDEQEGDHEDLKHELKHLMAENSSIKARFGTQHMHHTICLCGVAHQPAATVDSLRFYASRLRHNIFMHCMQRHTCTYAASVFCMNCVRRLFAVHDFVLLCMP